MIDIKNFAVGRLKNSVLKELVNEYLIRLRPYGKVEIIDIADGSGNTLEKKKREGERLAAALEKFPRSQVVLLDQNGKEFTSDGFAQFLMRNEKLVLVIGGPFGLSEELMSKGYLKVALSKMTFPHELARLILVEQIYRAVTIIKGKQYHY